MYARTYSATGHTGRAQPHGLAGDALSEYRTWSVPLVFRSEVMAALSYGPLNWPAYAAIRDRHGVNGDDFLGLVVSERLCWELQPFMLTRTP